MLIPPLTPGFRTHYPAQAQEEDRSTICLSPEEMPESMSLMGMLLVKEGQKHRTIAEKREVMIPKITLTPPHTPISTFLVQPDLETPSPMKHSFRARSHSTDGICSSTSHEGNQQNTSGPVEPRPSTRASVWAAVYALVFITEGRSAHSSIAGHTASVARVQKALMTGGPALEMRKRARGGAQGASSQKMTIITTGLVRDGSPNRGWQSIDLEEGGEEVLPGCQANGRGSAASIGLGMGMKATGSTQWSDWPSPVPLDQPHTRSAPNSPVLLETHAPGSDGYSELTATNGPPPAAPMTRSPTMPNLSTAHSYYGSVPTTPSPLGRFCTVATAAGDVLEKVPEGRFPFPACPGSPNKSPLTSPISPVPKRRKSAGGEMKMSTLVTTRFAGLPPKSPAGFASKGGSISPTDYSPRKESFSGQASSHLLPLSKQSRRYRAGSRSPLYILLLPVIVIVLHIYLSRVDRRFMDRGRSLVFGVPLRNSLAQLPDWLLRDVREEVFGQRDGPRHGIWLMHGNEEGDDASEEDIEGAWHTWSEMAETKTRTASASVEGIHHITKLLGWKDSNRSNADAVDKDDAKADVTGRESISL